MKLDRIQKATESHLPQGANIVGKPELRPEFHQEFSIEERLQLFGV